MAIRCKVVDYSNHAATIKLVGLIRGIILASNFFSRWKVEGGGVMLCVSVLCGFYRERKDEKVRL